MRVETRTPLPEDVAAEVATAVAKADDAARGGDVSSAAAMLDGVLTRVRAAGADNVSLWVSQPTPDHDALARLVGLSPGRDIYQMRRPLPAGEPPAGFVTRPFRVGQDEGAWLGVNNRAFAGHHEQSAWDLDTLRTRMSEPWFDANGFLLHERDGRLAGFNWTKVHRDSVPPLGEIYVIAVDPDFSGLGLGRALALAGLQWLHRQGIDVAMLYVDAANEAALAMYRSLGFMIDHVDRGYYAS